MAAVAQPWPPPTWPPAEPEPGPEHLATSVDWMSYSHQELYGMANQGVDLAGATTVSAKWAKLGAVLEEISADLKRAANASVDGWEGDGADKARDAVNRLVAWSADTAARATAVAGCVSRQADLAETARRTMPEPPAASSPAPPAPPHVTPGDGTAAMSASSNAFTSSAFASAGQLVTDSGPAQAKAQRLHQQAAEVMQRLQSGSNEVYGTVPSFTSLGKTADSRKLVQQKAPVKDPAPPKHEDTTTTSSAAPAPAGPVAPVGGVSAGAGAQPVAGVPQGPSLTGADEAGQRLTAGATQAVPPPAAAGEQAAPQRAMTGMPGMAGRGGHDEDKERKTPDYLQEEDDIWGLDGPVTPPVIGERQRDGF